MLPLLQTFKQLQACLGLVNFYFHFLPGAAQIPKPLTYVLRDSHKGSKPVPPPDAIHLAFQAVMQAVASACSCCSR